MRETERDEGGGETGVGEKKSPFYSSRPTKTKHAGKGFETVRIHKGTVVSFFLQSRVKS